MGIIGLNLASGQKPFKSTGDFEWVNVDVQSVPPDRVPDLQCDIRNLPYQDGQVDLVVLQHGVEHFVLTEGLRVLHEAHRVLKHGGHIIITWPDLKALAQRWLQGTLSDYLFLVNIYGAWISNDADCHKWGYTRETMRQTLTDVGFHAMDFDGRPIPGAVISKDFWIQGAEGIKK